VTDRHVTVTAVLTVPPGTEERFLAWIPRIVAATRAEPGCRNYDFHRSLREPHRFVFYENYVDQAAFDAHLQQPYIQEWVAFVEEQGGRFDVEHWRLWTPPPRP
jgi:quinol monooxygenase YgiN